MTFQRVKYLLIAGVLLCASLMLVFPLQAQDTCTATGGSIRNWHQASHWSCNHVPTSMDDVIIPAGITMRVSINTAYASTVTVLEGGTLELGQNLVPRGLNVVNDLLIVDGGTMRPGQIGTGINHTMWLGGDLDNNGTADFFLNGNFINLVITGTVQLNGVNPLNFNDLTITDDAAMTLPTGSLQPTVERTMINNGTLIQTQTVNNADIEFLKITDSLSTTVQYRGVDVDTANNLGDVTVTVRASDASSSEFCTTSGSNSPDYVDRCYDISPTTSDTALITLWASLSELNSIAGTNLAVYHNTGTNVWEELTTGQANGSDGGSYWFAQGETSTFSPFLMGGLNTPTAVSLQSFDTSGALPLGLILFTGGLLMTTLLVGWTLRRRRQSL